MALLPRAGGTSGAGADPSVTNKALWDFAHEVTLGDISNKYFDFPTGEPDMLTGGEPHVIGILNGIAQFLGDYTVIQDSGGKWRRLTWDGLPLETTPPIQAGDKVWVIYPVGIIGSGSGGSGTDDHEGLNNLYPSSIGTGRHNHLTDAQLADLITIINNWVTMTDHEALDNLLPGSIGTGNHNHLTDQQLEDLIKIILPPPIDPDEDDPTKPGYIPRGHEELSQLFPAGLAKGDHFHLSKKLSDALMGAGPETPDIVSPSDNTSVHFNPAVPLSMPLGVSGFSEITPLSAGIMPMVSGLFNWEFELEFTYRHPGNSNMRAYQIQISKNPRFLTIFRTDTIDPIAATPGTVVSHHISETDENTWEYYIWYYFKVRVQDTEGRWSMWSHPISVYCGMFGHEDLRELLPAINPRGEHWHLTKEQLDYLEELVGKGPLRPILILPADGSVFDFSIMLLRVFGKYEHPLGKAMTNYIIEISEDSDLVSLMYSTNLANWTVPDAMLEVGTGPGQVPLEPDKDYYVRIKVVDVEGVESAWSNINHFTTANVAVPPPGGGGGGTFISEFLSPRTWYGTNQAAFTALVTAELQTGLRLSLSEPRRTDGRFISEFGIPWEVTFRIVVHDWSQGPLSVSVPILTHTLSGLVNGAIDDIVGAELTTLRDAALHYGNLNLGLGTYGQVDIVSFYADIGDANGTRIIISPPGALSASQQWGVGVQFPGVVPGPTYPPQQPSGITIIH